ncbi:radical SAM domain protein [Clostridiaceae bacterium JG1575]|nr:radical SAM domain protein [Clostridiaceae bacterium JG1575]
MIVPFFIPFAGCGHRCIFCNQETISGALAQQLPSPKELQDTLERYLQSVKDPSQPVEAAFYGGSFTALPWSDQERLLSAIFPYRVNGTLKSLRVSTRPDAITQEGLERLKAYGVETVELGVQSMEDEVLWQSGRFHTAADTIRASKAICEADLHLVHQLMPGLLGASFSGDLYSLRASAALRPEAVRLYPTLVLRGTPLERLYREGRYAPRSLEETVAHLQEMMTFLDEEGIEILRMGLQETPSLLKSLICGPHHPALRELVLSRRLAGRIACALAGDAKAQLWIHPYDASILNANRKQYRSTLPKTLAVHGDFHQVRGVVTLRRRGQAPIEICI